MLVSISKSLLEKHLSNEQHIENERQERHYVFFHEIFYMAC